MALKVRQREYGIGLRGENNSVLQTENIWTCTGFVGVNKQGVAFLCHFDTPCSVRSLPQIIADLSVYVKDFSAFEIRIVSSAAGKLLGWMTRYVLKKKLKELNVFLSIPEAEFLTDNCFEKCGIRVDADTGTIRTDKYAKFRDYERYNCLSWFKFGVATRATVQKDEADQETS